MSNVQQTTTVMSSPRREKSDKRVQVDTKDEEEIPDIGGSPRPISRSGQLITMNSPKELALNVYAETVRKETMMLTDIYRVIREMKTNVTFDYLTLKERLQQLPNIDEGKKKDLEELWLIKGDLNSCNNTGTPDLSLLKDCAVRYLKILEKNRPSILGLESVLESHSQKESTCKVCKRLCETYKNNQIWTNFVKGVSLIKEIRNFQESS